MGGVFRWRCASRRLADHPGRLALTVAVLAAGTAALPVLGFFVTTALMVLGLPVLLGYRRAVPLVPLAAAFLGLLYAVFVLLLRQPLPAGLLW